MATFTQQVFTKLRNGEASLGIVVRQKFHSVPFAKKGDTVTLQESKGGLEAFDGTRWVRLTHSFAI